MSCVPIGMSCVRLISVMRSSRNVLCSVHACCLPPVRQTGRLAICSVPVPPWVVIVGSAFSNRRCGYPTFLVHFGLARSFMAIPTENEGTRGTESAARQSAFLRKHIDFAVFSAGSTLGQKVEAALRPRPRLRQRAIGSLDSLHLGRDVGAFHTAKGTQAQRRLDRLAFVLRLSCVPLGMSCVRFTPAVCRLCAKQNGLRYVPFLFRRGS